MKKLMMLTLGLAFLTGTYAIAQDQPQEAPKVQKKTKKTAKKKKAAPKKAAEQPQQ